VIGGWRKLHNKELYNLHPLPSIIRMTKSRMIKLAGHVARTGDKRNTYRTLIKKTEGKRPLGRHRHSWKDNIEVDLR
jgi:hypothetical protein